MVGDKKKIINRKNERWFDTESIIKQTSEDLQKV
jgi:hypothetical protein